MHVKESAGDVVSLSIDILRVSLGNLFEGLVTSRLDATPKRSETKSLTSLFVGAQLIFG